MPDRDFLVEFEENFANFSLDANVLLFDFSAFAFAEEPMVIERGDNKELNREEALICRFAPCFIS